MKIVPDGSQHQFAKRGLRVKLREDKADVYTKAYKDSEAIIKQIGIDPVGEFPMIYIEWDKKHWRYNGEPDMWTFESHFEPVEVNMTEENSNPADILKQLAALIAPVLKAQSEEKTEEKETEEKEAPESPDMIPIIPVDEAHDFSLPLTNTDDFVEALSQAFESASEAEAFAIIAIKPVNNPFRPGQNVLMPDSYVAYNTEAAGYTLHLALSEMAASFHGEAIAKILHDKFKENDEPGRNPPTDS